MSFKFTAPAAVTLCLWALSGCSTVSSLWQMYDGSVSTSLREPTGYYEHTEVSTSGDRLVVPEGLNQPARDRTLMLPEVNGLLPGAVGANMDVRAPVVQLRSAAGLQSVWADGESIVWLNSGSTQNVADESQAWELLMRALERMHLQVGEVTPGAYEFTTAAADFNEYGTPRSMTAAAEEDGVYYRQIYRIRIGRNAAGNIGIATSVIGSMTVAKAGLFSFSTTRTLNDILTPAELERFAVGFSNHLIRSMQTVTAAAEYFDGTVSVTLDRDNNGQDCLVVDAPYQRTWDVMRNLLPDWGFTVTEYSVSHSSFKVEYDEPDADFFQARGVDNFGLEDGEYIIRVSIDRDRTFIIFYNKDDHPLKPQEIARLYPGFSAALTRAFAAYGGTGL